MERYKSGLTGKGSQTPDPKFEFKKTEFKQSLKLPKASTNPRASDYLKKRKLNPMKFYYAEKFMAFCNQIKPGSFSTIKNDHARIVIPLYSPSKELIGLQGRSLDSWIQPKYLTLMFTDKYSKIYGLDTINKKLPVYVVEGPFDSTFIDNCVLCVVVMVTLVILRGAISFLYMITSFVIKKLLAELATLSNEDTKLSSGQMESETRT